MGDRKFSTEDDSQLPTQNGKLLEDFTSIKHHFWFVKSVCNLSVKSTGVSQTTVSCRSTSDR